MRIGYACLTRGVPETNMRSCIMKNAAPERLAEIIEHNLTSLKNMLVFNAENNIKLFRISSDLIPFGSSPVNRLKWRDIFSEKISHIAEYISHNSIRVSMHPGQYTVLNSPNPEVVERAVKDLVYHEKVLTALNTDVSSKIILHLGGVYGDKKNALKRFAQVYQGLDKSIKQRIAIENDDRSYNISDVLEISEKLKVPVIYDNLHGYINPSGHFPHSYWIKKCSHTWSNKDGNQKIHYSQQAQDKSPGSHSATISARGFAAFLNEIGDMKPDIMLEVKDKNISAVKCKNIINRSKEALIKDWRRYKYKVLEMSPTHHNKAENILKKTNPDPLVFYGYVEAAFNENYDDEKKILAARTIWDVFFGDADNNDTGFFTEKLSLFSKKEYPYTKIKSFLMKMALKYEKKELYDSYYFNL